ncbi:MAG: carotenoid biosynthesis protein [Candidatus Thorarchaeota archaeon]|nr:carotenoid biosynthesis protein [Candidatus Thorarchaeota archaeon]
MSKLNKIEASLIILIIAILYITTVIAKVISAPVGFLGVLVTVLFVLLHGSKFYGPKNLIVFIIITFTISWTLESLSIAIGFPFGNYYYTGLGKIGEVPWIIMPAYLGTGYLSWSIAHILVGKFTPEIQGKQIGLIPFVAAFVMVMWDLVMDPILSTIQGEWVWEDGGFYFGVPLTNYFGWFFTIFLIYFIFAFFLSKNADESLSTKVDSKFFWHSIPLMYLGISFQFLLAPFFATTFPMIYWSMLLITIFTMVFVSLISILRVQEEFR